MNYRINPVSFILFPFLLIAYINIGCTDNPIAPGDAALIQGRVIHASTSRPVEGVLVRSNAFAETAVTDENGEYSLEAQLDDTVAVLVVLSFTKNGFQETTLTVAVRNGQNTPLPDVEIEETGGTSGESGPASNVVLLTVQRPKVFVKRSGGNETTDLTFEVRDNNGVPIDLDHQATVFFRIISGPGGEEFVSPDSALTSNSGRATTTLNSGTVAGTVQIIAEVVGTSIQSEPVPIAINGWLPDQDHFGLGVERINFAGIKTFGLENQMTAFVGDKFSNPVPPGTAVQFFSTGGIIQGSSTTDSLGTASVTLLSAAPAPPGINFSQLRILNPNNLPPYFAERGYALITAQTQDENHQQIYAENVVLFSGTTVIADVNPTTFDLGPDESVTIDFRVSDENRNPLVQGTLVQVSVNNGSVTGDSNVQLDDTRSRAATQFRVRVTNSSPGDIEGEDTTVTINVLSPNGDARVSIFGRMRRTL